MNNPLDIIGVVKELAECDCYCDDDNLCDPCVRILEVFRPAADALLIAYGCLKNHEHLVRGECIEGCDMCEALSQIRNLKLS